MIRNRYLSFTLLFLAALLLGTPLPADNVSKERASRIAGNFLSNSVTLESESPLTRSSESTPYYIFNSTGDGFVIVSGEDALPPVLAYSYNGRFSTTDIPDNVRWWLDAMSSTVETTRSRGIKSTPRNTAQWERLEWPTRSDDITIEPEKLIKTPSWNQNGPYNKYCFTHQHKQALAGCAPLAMSIAMYIIKHPTEPFKASGDSTITYRWDSMLSTYKGNYTEEQADAVARLVAENGRRSNASYGEASNGTSVRSDAMVPAILSYKYPDGTSVFDLSVRMVYRQHYSSDDWIEMMRREICQGRVVMYGGVALKDNSGHEFIVDGYDKNGNLHINYGWGGSNDGYYNIYNIEFDTYQDAIIDFKANVGGRTHSQLILERYRGGYVGLSTNTTSFSAGTTFELKAGAIVNYGTTAFKGDIAVFHLDRDGLILEQVSEVKSFAEDELKPDYFTTGDNISCTIGIEPNPGDVLALFYREDALSEWEKMPCDVEDAECIGELPLYDSKTIEESTSIEFQPSSRLLTITAKDGVEATLTDSAGYSISLSSESVTNGIKYSATISSGVGKCTLHLTKKSEDVTLTINFGQ